MLVNCMKWKMYGDSCTIFGIQSLFCLGRMIDALACNEVWFYGCLDSEITCSDFSSGWILQMPGLQQTVSLWK